MQLFEKFMLEEIRGKCVKSPLQVWGKGIMQKKKKKLENTALNKYTHMDVGQTSTTSEMTSIEEIRPMSVWKH